MNSAVDFDNLSEILTCPICMEYLKRPCETSCGHAFCEYCLNKWLEQSEACPSCRKNALPAHPSFTLRDLVKALGTNHEKTTLRPPTADEERETGNRCFRAGTIADAILHYSNSIDLNQNDPKTYSNRAACYIKIKQYTLALEDCNRAIALDPYFVKAIYRKAICQECMHQVGLAVETLEMAKRADKDGVFINEIDNAVDRIVEGLRDNYKRSTFFSHGNNDDDDDDDDDSGGGGGGGGGSNSSNGNSQRQQGTPPQQQQYQGYPQYQPQNYSQAQPPPPQGYYPQDYPQAPPPQSYPQQQQQQRYSPQPSYPPPQPPGKSSKSSHSRKHRKRRDSDCSIQ